MSAAEILQSYVIRLGYQVDTNSVRKFMGGMSSTERRIAETRRRIAASQLALQQGYGAVMNRQIRQQRSHLQAQLRGLQQQQIAAAATERALVGVAGAFTAIAVASVVAETKFADYMRKTYFKAELAGTSVGGLGGMELTSKAFGMDPNALADMTKNIRMMLMGDAGMKALVESITKVNIETGKSEDIIWGIVKAAKSITSFVPQQIAWAEKMGMPRETFLLLKEHPELESRMRRGTEINKEMGYDPEKEKANILALSMKMDDIVMKTETLGRIVGSKVSGPMYEMMDAVDKWLSKMPGNIRNSDKFSLIDTLTPDSRAARMRMSQNDIDNFMSPISGIKSGAEYLWDKIKPLAKSAAGAVGGAYDSVRDFNDSAPRRSVGQAGNLAGGILNSIFTMEAMGYRDLMRDLHSADVGYLGLNNSMTPIGGSNSTSNSVNTINITQNITGTNAHEIAIESGRKIEDSVTLRNIKNPFGNK